MTIQALKPRSATRLAPLTAAAASLPNTSSSRAMCWGLMIPPDCSMAQSITFSVAWRRKSAISGVSMGPGHRLLVRTPNRVRLRWELCMVHTCTSSLDRA